MGTQRNGTKLALATLALLAGCSWFERGGSGGMRDGGADARPPQADAGTGCDEAHATMAELAEAGVDFDDVTVTLEKEGVASFAASFRDAVDTLEKKSRELT